MKAEKGEWWYYESRERRMVYYKNRYKMIKQEQNDKTEKNDSTGT